MTNDNTVVSFEMIDKTALEFAIALIASGDRQTMQSLSKNSMKLAKAWHEKTDFRKSWLLSKNLTEDDWIKVDYDSDYDENDFKVGKEYWIIRLGEHPDGGVHPEKAVCTKIATRNERQQPFFHLAFNPYSQFPIMAYLPLHISSQLLDETPSHPTRPSSLYSNL